MTFISILSATILSILFFGVAQLIVSRSTFYQAAVQSANKALDGLRGFLALEEPGFAQVERYPIEK